MSQLGIERGILSDTGRVMGLRRSRDWGTHKARQVHQWNRLCSPEIDPCMYETDL